MQHNERLIEELRQVGLTDEQIARVVGRANMKSTLATMAQQFVQQLSRLGVDNAEITVRLWANFDGDSIVGYEAQITVAVKHNQLGQVGIDEVMTVAVNAAGNNAAGNGSGDGNVQRCIELVEKWASQFGIDLPEKWRQYANVAACRIAKRLLRQGKLHESDSDIQWLKVTYSRTWDNV